MTLPYKGCALNCNLHNSSGFANPFCKGGNSVKEEEKRKVSWEVKDPKPPIIQSGRMENRRQS